MKKLVMCVMSACLALSAFAQNNIDISSADPKSVGTDTGKQSLKEIVVDLFEQEGSWYVDMASDYGIASSRLFDGVPANKDPLPEDTANAQDSKVFGAKIEFYKRGVNTFYLYASRPIAIEGITKTVSFWVAGRNYNHSISLILRDFNGKEFELYVGTLNFSGWKKLSVAVPPSPDGRHGVIQSNPHYTELPGVRIVGFRVDCDPEEAYGTYYLYMDDLRAVSDLYTLDLRDEDDMSDNW